MKEGHGHAGKRDTICSVIMVGAGIDAAGLVPDGGLLVGGDQLQVAGVVVALLAARRAVGARGGGAGSRWRPSSVEKNGGTLTVMRPISA